MWVPVWLCIAGPIVSAILGAGVLGLIALCQVANEDPRWRRGRIAATRGEL